MLMALCIAPMLCALWLRLKKGPVRENPIIRLVKGIYVPVLLLTFVWLYLRDGREAQRFALIAENLLSLQA